jgi:putative addiction module killer protein
MRLCKITCFDNFIGLAERYHPIYKLYVSVLVRSSDFDIWLRDLLDHEAKAKILVRLNRAELGNLGDWSAVGSGVSEMRIHCGAGYRVYFVRNNMTTYLLTGGTKDSQRRDIERAMGLAKALKERKQ